MQSAGSIERQGVVTLLRQRQYSEVERIGVTSRHEGPKRRNRATKWIKAKGIHRHRWTAHSRPDSRIAARNAGDEHKREAREGGRGVNISRVGRITSSQGNAAYDRHCLSLLREESAADQTND